MEVKKHLIVQFVQVVASMDKNGKVPLRCFINYNNEHFEHNWKQVNTEYKKSDVEFVVFVEAQLGGVWLPIMFEKQVIAEGRTWNDISVLFNGMTLLYGINHCLRVAIDKKLLAEKRMNAALIATAAMTKYKHEDVLKLHNEGHSYKQIMDKLGILSKGTVSWIINKSVASQSMV